MNSYTFVTAGKLVSTGGGGGDCKSRLLVTVANMMANNSFERAKTDTMEYMDCIFRCHGVLSGKGGAKNPMGTNAPANKAAGVRKLLNNVRAAAENGSVTPTAKAVDDDDDAAVGGVDVCFSRDGRSGTMVGVVAWGFPRILEKICGCPADTRNASQQRRWHDR